MDPVKEIKKILSSGTLSQVKALFVFDSQDSDEKVIFKFNLWVRHYLPKYFTSEDAKFHGEIDRFNLKCYREKFTFVNIVFRGGAKTTKTKLFIAFVIANDLERKRKYFKVLAENGDNSKQSVTDIYNILITYAPELFVKSKVKREETMGSFTTVTGIKVVSGTVGTDQRGALQEESRPDFIWFDDFENRKTLRSAVKTKSIWDNMEEARLALSTDGSCVYTANYISEAGNVHRLVTKHSKGKKVLIVPIISKEGVVAWDRYSESDIEAMRQEDDDFEGERLCEPSASRDIYFDRDSLDRQVPKLPISVSAGFKMFQEFDPTHEYAGGHDVAKGVGLDSCASVYIDFTTNPAQVVGTFASDTIKPEIFGYEIQRQGDMFGGCLECVENNLGGGGDTTIVILKQLGVPQYEKKQDNIRITAGTPTEYGWNTNANTKPTMLASLGRAVKDGLLILNDIDIINELKGYTRNDLLETSKDPRLTTRHFDLLIACCLAWEMRNFRLPSISKEIKARKKSQAKRQNYKQSTKYGG